MQRKRRQPEEDQAKSARRAWGPGGHARHLEQCALAVLPLCALLLLMLLDWAHTAVNAHHAPVRALMQGPGTAAAAVITPRR
jgi:hypothetical protein